MAKPLNTSSGDILADRRADYAEMLFGSGEAGPAAELMLGALELAPGWAMGWFRLGEFHEAAGDMNAAAEAWRMAQELDPADRAGAALKLAVIGKAEAGDAPPSAFVEALFDQYAEKFDHALVDTLGYRVPEFLAEAIAKARRGRFGLALDLGCGTGLMGERLRPFCDRLEGFDISAEMLRKARAKGVYDRLEKADLQAFSYDGPKADLVTAADVFMYVGALEGIVRTVAGLLTEDGLFAFSVERLEAADGFALQPSRRYAHAEAYVRRVIGEAGLAVVSIEEKTIRQDRNEPVTGLIVTARPL
ncbi:methyltransferase domain-containing protein [Mesorhizobium sp. KR9-304]|uniref:methyltransferase domain-containing protein n=1 Tax=Mesorhizobium sp. KR9-304 TaxID=3156614 RepID=UPI0032B49CDD